jgi:FixJ family two-component response regulator
MKSRVVVFLTRPIDEVALIAGAERALDLNKTYLKETLEHSPPREQQVLPLLASGPPNKQAAEELGSPQILCECTVDKSRGEWKPSPPRR